MSAKQYVLGLVDPGREVRRPPLVGMQFLHQRAMGTSDLVGARARLQAKDLIGLLLRHWPASRRAARAPLPHQHPRAHASRGPGGPDTLRVGRGFPRRSHRAGRTSVGTSSASSCALVRPAARMRPRIAPVSWSSSISTKAVRTRETWPGSLVPAAAEAGRHARPQVKQRKAGDARAGRRIRTGRSPPARRPPRARRRRRLFAARARPASDRRWRRTCSPHNSRTRMSDAEEERGHGAISAAATAASRRRDDASRDRPAP